MGSKDDLRDEITNITENQYLYTKMNALQFKFTKSECYDQFCQIPWKSICKWSQPIPHT